MAGKAREDGEENRNFKFQNITCLRELSCRTRTDRKKIREVNPTVVENWQRICKTIGSNPVDEFVWPEKDGNAVLDSLCWHAQRHAEAKATCAPPTDAELREVLYYVERDVGCYYETDEFNWDLFVRILEEDIDGKKSPGYPWIDRGITENSQFNSNLELALQLYVAVLERLEKLKTEPVSDPINIFIKDEPHSNSKAEQKRWRLISGCSITDNIVDRVLFGNFMNAVDHKAKRLQTKALAGWTPLAGGYKRLAKMLDKPQSSDKRAWDWTAQEWVLRALCELFIRCNIKGEIYRQMFENRFAALFGNVVFKLGSTSILQVVYGIMKSGWLGTLVGNSICQLILHDLARLRSGSTRKFAVAVGDDMNQEVESERYWDELKRTGCIIKEKQEIPGYPTEFCGVKFDKEEAIPLYPGKNMFKLLFSNSKDFVQSLRCYQLLYAYHPLFELLQRMAYSVNNVVSRKYAQVWFDGLE